MKNIFEGIESYIQQRELFICLLLTGILLFLSFVGHSRLSTTQVTDRVGQPHTVFVSYYGFPFEMIGLLNPLNDDQSSAIEQSGGGTLRMLWDGFFLDFVLYFLLAFVIVYSYRRLGSR
jgi:hypothetical protein